MSSAMRQAALLLHHLPPGEDAYFLSKVAEETRQTLLPLLDELKRLGVPKDFSFIKQVLTRDASDVNKMTGFVLEESYQRLFTLSPEEAFELLIEEPLRLQINILSIAPWPWLDGYLRLLRHEVGRSTVAKIRKAIASSNLPTPVRDLHALGFCKRLEEKKGR